MKCVKIEYIEEDYDLCDLEIDGGANNYIANGIVVHNTWCSFGYHPKADVPIITSKGLSGKGLAFKHNLANENNLYLNQFQRLTYTDINEEPLFKDGPVGTTILDRAAKVLIENGSMYKGTPFYILGEIFGQGIQDVGWYDPKEKHFRVFDIYIGEPGKGRYLNTDEVVFACQTIGLETVPVLYRGRFSKEIMEKYTTGNETVSGHGLNIREGIVIKPAKERRDIEIGRVILKSVSEKYLLRKNGTEFN